MKITHIAISNYQRLTQVDMPVRAPLLLLSGPNEQGKTSLADAIYHVCNGAARRVKLKKDFAQLVHDGQKSGIVSLTIADNGESRDIALKIPQDKRSGDAEMSPLLAVLLDQKAFPRMEPNARRELLFGITGTRISGKTIVEKLKEKGASEAKVKEISATLLAGFAAGADEATRKASEARGAWKAMTGENYGSEKGKAWTADKPEYDAAQIAKLETDIPAADKKVSELTAQKATLDERRRAFTTREEQKKSLQQRADGLERAKAKLDTDQADVDEWTRRVAEAERQATGQAAIHPLTCPHCAGLVELKGSELIAHEPPEKVADEKAKALLPTYRDSLTKVTRFRDNDQQAVRDAEAAVATLAEYAKSPLEPVDIAEVQRIEADLAIAQKHVKSLRESHDALKANRDAATRAEQKTKDALQHHTDVVEWAQMAEWLSPNGIQSELLGAALQPFNLRLEAAATITGWDKVTIDADMTIRIGGRPYSLASASAQWRAEAEIVEAIAWVSKVRSFMLDDVEILVGPNRLAFLKWMHTLAANGNIDTAILIGSFKERPQCPPTFQVEWLEGGYLVHADQPEAAEPA
jgi:hypothetical protein